jgi:hypothetical protein
MKIRILAVLALFLLSLNLAAPSLADTKIENAAPSGGLQLVSILPASDAVAVMDTRRFFGEAMPKILSGNPTLLGMLTAKLDEAQAKTGIDIRQFESVAAGFTFKKTTGKDFDIEPVVIARGQINAVALISAAKIASKGKYREVKVGTRTLYVFAAREMVKQQVRSADPKKARVVDRVSGKVANELAFTAYDANTIAFGTLPRLRETLAAKTHVSTDLTDYLGRTEGAFAEFAGKMPNGMGAMVPLDNDELGKNIDSIRFVYGSMSVIGDATSLRMAARTMQPEQAQSLKETLEGLQMIGKAFLGGSKGADKQVYARMIENSRFAVNGNEVSLDLSIPQSDIDILVGSIKLSDQK